MVDLAGRVESKKKLKFFILIFTFFAHLNRSAQISCTQINHLTGFVEPRKVIIEQLWNSSQILTYHLSSANRLIV